MKCQGNIFESGTTTVEDFNVYRCRIDCDRGTICDFAL